MPTRKPAHRHHEPQVGEPLPSTPVAGDHDLDNAMHPGKPAPAPVETQPQERSESRH